MYVSTSQFGKPLVIGKTNHQRVAAAAAVSFKHSRKKTRLDQLYQQGSAKVRFPKNHSNSLEAVLINTAGGLTGGDKISWDIKLAEGCNVVTTTQACEKSYKSTSGAAQVQTSIALAKGSALHWLPQETILYDGSSLARTFTVELEEGAELLALECVVLGREAMGETISQVDFHDRWRVERDGKMLFADDLRLKGAEPSLAGFGNNRAVASLLFVGAGDEEKQQALVKRLRDVCPAKQSGFSAFEGKITARILAVDSYHLRQVLLPVLKCLREADLPRVWRI